MSSLENLKVIDTSKGLTDTEIGNLKEISRFWAAGKIIVIVILSIGTVSLALLNVWSLGAKWIR